MSVKKIVNQIVHQKYNIQLLKLDEIDNKLQFIWMSWYSWGSQVFNTSTPESHNLIL